MVHQPTRTPACLSDRLAALGVFVLALFSCLAWRLELALTTGWEGTDWISSHHFAVPVCVALVAAWTARFVPGVDNPRYRTGLMVVLFVVMCAGAIGASFMLECFFGGPWSEVALCMVLHLFVPHSWPLPSAQMIIWLMPVFWMLFPVVFFKVCGIYGVKVPGVRMAFSVLGFLAAWPLAALVRMPFDDRPPQHFVEIFENPNLIETFKSGFVMPFLVLALGLPLVRIPSSSHGRDGLYGRDERRDQAPC